MRHNLRNVKPAPTAAEIPDLWLEAVALESLAPINLRGGIARARTALLAAIPQWELTSFLERLQETSA